MIHEFKNFSLTIKKPPVCEIYHLVHLEFNEFGMSLSYVMEDESISLLKEILEGGCEEDTKAFLIKNLIMSNLSRQFGEDS